MKKVAKTSPEANYMGPDKAPFQCGHCEYFVKPHACEKVTGSVDAKGCCNLYESIGKGATRANAQNTHWEEGFQPQPTA